MQRLKIAVTQGEGEYEIEVEGETRDIENLFTFLMGVNYIRRLDRYDLVNKTVKVEIWEPTRGRN